MSTNTYETILFSSGPLLGLISAAFGLKVWLLFEIFASISLALVLLAQPELILSLMLKSQLTSLHRFLAALYGCYLVYSVLVPIFLRNSKDKTVLYGHFVARIFASAIILLDNSMAYLEGKQWNYKLLCFSAGIAITDLLVNLYFGIKCQRETSNGEKSRITDYIARLEGFILFTVGMLLFAFPDRVMTFSNKLDESHRSLCRTVGAFMISLFFESFYVVDYLYNSDRKRFLLAHLSGSVLETFIILAGHYYYQVYKIEYMFILLGANTLYNLTCIFGYLVTPAQAKLSNNAKRK